ncbi:MAG: alpha/beta fold hydrolase [Microbacteriaceae bacterium]
MTQQLDVSVGNRTVHAWDSGSGSALTLVWHHGSPQTGAPLEPVARWARERDIRLVTYSRPSYGGSTAQPGRTVADAPADVTAVLDALDIDRFATMGASGGGPHAMACGALLAPRVVGVVCLAGIAPYTADFDWFAGMASPDDIRAALDGRDARTVQENVSEWNDYSFSARDYAALQSTWGSLSADVGVASAAGSDGLIDDDVAFVTPWGFSLAAVTVPTLLAQGGDDRVVPRAHAEWMLTHLPNAELWLRPHDGHISVMNAAPVAMDWLLAQL